MTADRGRGPPRAAGSPAPDTHRSGTAAAPPSSAPAAAAATRPVRRSDPPAVSVDDRLDHGQPQPASLGSGLPGGVCSVEWLEQALGAPCRDAWAAVRHTDPAVVPPRGERDVDRLTDGGELAGI